MTTILIFDFVSLIKPRPPKHCSQSHDVKIFQVFEFGTFTAFALWPLNVIGCPKFLWGGVDVVDKSEIEVTLVPARVIWTALPKVVTEPSPTMFLFMGVIAR